MQHSVYAVWQTNMGKFCCFCFSHQNFAIIKWGTCIRPKTFTTWRTCVFNCMMCQIWHWRHWQIWHIIQLKTQYLSWSQVCLIVPTTKHSCQKHRACQTILHGWKLLILEIQKARVQGLPRQNPFFPLSNFSKCVVVLWLLLATKIKLRTNTSKYYCWKYLNCITCINEAE